MKTSSNQMVRAKTGRGIRPDQLSGGLSHMSGLAAEGEYRAVSAEPLV
ncbi:hypothetical protein [Agrobacterium tumefaciens]|nr:hypothetical protein [Agrobacterium tumefaciens]NSX93153.1 hypothetical protein [Agrobacterium tumefaciens]